MDLIGTGVKQIIIIMEENNHQGTSNSANERPDCVFFLRKNKFYYSEHSYHLGKATEIVEISKSFNYLYDLLLDKSLVEIRGMIESGSTIYQMDSISFYKYYNFRNTYVKRLKLEGQLDELNMYRDYLSNEGYQMSIDTIDDFKIFNQICPLNVYETLATNNNYFLAPKWNELFFAKANRSVPSQSATFDVESLEDFHLTKGLYIDSLDFWLNLARDTNAFGYLTHFYSVEFSKLDDEEKKIDWAQYGFIVKDGILTPSAADKSFSYYLLNNFLSIPPIVFDKVPLDKYQEYQMASYKDNVIEYYLDRRFGSGGYYDHDNMMNDKSLNFWVDLLISEDLAKSTIEMNINEVEEKAKELIKRY